LTTGRVLGGTAAISVAVAAAAETAGRAASTAMTGSVTAHDKGGNKYTFLSGSTTALTVTYLPSDVFVVGGTSTDLNGFESRLSVNDTVAYTPASVAGPARHELTDQPRPVLTGQAVAGLTANGDNKATPSANDGGKFTLATATGTSLITYRSAQAGDSFTVNGTPTSEQVFEQHYSAGDEISFRAADVPSGTGQVVQMVDRVLAGAVKRASVNTANSNQSGNPANSYAVLATTGTIELQTVVYANAASAGTDVYVVNGQSVTLAVFETALNQVKNGTKTASVIVDRAGSGANLVETHRVTTS
jgi:hypothetical protein